MLQLLKVRRVLAFYTLEMFTELGSGFGGGVAVSPFYLIEDPKYITVSLPPLLRASSCLMLPLFFGLLKRRNWKSCFPLGLFPLVSSSDFTYSF